MILRASFFLFFCCVATSLSAAPPILKLDYPRTDEEYLRLQKQMTDLRTGDRVQFDDFPQIYTLDRKINQGGNTQIWTFDEKENSILRLTLGEDKNGDNSLRDFSSRVAAITAYHEGMAALENRGFPVPRTREYYPRLGIEVERVYPLFSLRDFLLNRENLAIDARGLEAELIKFFQALAAYVYIYDFHIEQIWWCEDRGWMLLDVGGKPEFLSDVHPLQVLEEDLEAFVKKVILSPIDQISFDVAHYLKSKIASRRWGRLEPQLQRAVQKARMELQLPNPSMSRLQRCKQLLHRLRGQGT